MDGDSDELVFFVNGKKVVEKNADPETTLLHYLRTKLRLTGTKLGCAEGGCGACTVMVSRCERPSGNIIHYSVNACLAPVCAMHGLAVTTVEGIGSTKTQLHPVQERIAKSHGSQCGFCTPGIVMSMYTLLRNTRQPSMETMENAFQGNLCRCTGYRPILEGFKTFTKEYCCGQGESCCKNGPLNPRENDRLFEPSEFVPLDQTQEPIFPPELQLSNKLDNKLLVFRGERTTWLRPVTLNELLDLKAKHPQSRMVVGNTEVGIEVKFKNMTYPVIIAPTHVPELLEVKHTNTGITFGSSVSLSRLNQILVETVNKLPEHKTRVFAAIIEMLRWFAGDQIRNVAAISGNIMTASPISDLNPIFMSAGCLLIVCSKERGARELLLDHTFFLGYRRTVVEPDEVLISVHVPFTSENEYFYAYKQAQRREDDISIVNAAMKVEFEQGGNTIKQMALSFGGMAPTTVMALRAAQQAVGRKWEDDLVTDMCGWLADDLPLTPDAPGGQTEYRRTLTTSFFFKFYLSVQMRLSEEKVGLSNVPRSYRSALPVYYREPIKSTQVYEEVPEAQSEKDAVGRPLPHKTGSQQATGEAQYCDDMPYADGELYLALVTSTRPHAKILNIDTSDALKMTGVKAFFCHKDVPGNNKGGPTPVKDEEVFASEKVTCVGQVIGAVVADNQAHAQRAAKAVIVEYEDLPAIVTIEEAIEAGSFHPPARFMSCGDVDQGFAQSDHVLTGEKRVGGQEHFYLETQVTRAVPRGEDGEMEVFSSTQAPSMGQFMIANALGVPANRITVRVKRLGGGFGGKETRFHVLMVPVAVAAFKLNCPVRCMLDRDEDMLVTGGRHPFLGKYKVGFSNSGKILALDAALYSNAGNSADLSLAVMERAMFHIDSCYKLHNVRVVGHLCKTNLPSNTAFRGFGGPQGLMIMETLINDIADYLGVSPLEVRELNMYKENDVTHFDQKLVNCNIRRCWDEVIKQSNFHRRRQEIDIYNSENRWKKRGIAVIPTKFGISFTLSFLNQGGALVHVYQNDGSVLITHGGTEMGQGLHTKMSQVASRALNIPISKIHISETSTNMVPNASASAASACSDLYGMAILNACQIIMERLEPYRIANSKGTWEDWVKAAYFDRVSLSTAGFYKTPDIQGFDWENNKGMMPFNYFTFGAACSEVEIDCLTGDHTVLRTDIVMDVGTSLNPAIDIGQIEGAFAQGYGMFTIEQLKFSPQGSLINRGPGAYKLPGFGDVPVEFNVSLLKGASNPRAVYSSKAIGEPPLFLASSVFFAIKDAISSARADSGVPGLFKLDSPATPERIRMACVDQFTKQFPPAEAGSYKPWFVHV